LEAGEKVKLIGRKTPGGESMTAEGEGTNRDMGEMSRDPFERDQRVERGRLKRTFS